MVSLLINKKQKPSVTGWDAERFVLLAIFLFALFSILILANQFALLNNQIQMNSEIGRLTGLISSKGGRSTDSGYCGDGICSAIYGEDRYNCPQDCQPQEGFCGDGKCDISENNLNCPEDCERSPTCGDGICGVGESCKNCAYDCSGECNSACKSEGSGFCNSPEKCSYSPLKHTCTCVCKNFEISIVGFDIGQEIEESP